MLDQVTRRRVMVVDVARGLALLAMASYHGAWDLMYQRYLTVDVTVDPVWRAYAEGIAATFLTLVGVSLVLATAVPFPKALQRVGRIALAAVLVSAVTLYLFPDEWIYFGVLHHIALASLLARPLVRAPWVVLSVALVAAFAIPFYLTSSFFDPRYLAWAGLAAHPAAANDFVPLLPWFGFVLSGVALARAAHDFGLMGWLGKLSLPLPLKGLAFLGRHSLAFYLIHQPVLFGLAALLPYVMPPDPVPGFVQSCTQQCEASGGASCAPMCACVGASLNKTRFFSRWTSLPQEVVAMEVQDAAKACRAP